MSGSPQERGLSRELVRTDQVGRRLHNSRLGLGKGTHHA